ncbi:MAG: hypothetical protein O9972_17725 [Burkholderiales bacterium]|nr:hypothetical protein [Burkholderiales bacterium]
MIATIHFSHRFGEFEMSIAMNELHLFDEPSSALIAALSKSDEEERARREALAGLLRPTAVERSEAARIGRRLLAGLREEARPEADRVRTLKIERHRILSDLLDSARNSRFRPPIVVDPVPAPVDHSFWWASTEWAPADEYEWGKFEIEGTWRNGKVVFSGWLYKTDGDLTSGSLRATAWFELQPARLPASPSGVLRSSPSIQIFGTVAGSTDGFDFWQPWEGDKWCRCWLNVRQRLFQNGFGGPIVLADRSEGRVLIDRQNDGGETRAVLPGALAMPVLDFRPVAVAESVWASLEVRIDYQIEGDASSLRFYDQPIEIAFAQWVPSPV